MTYGCVLNQNLCVGQYKLQPWQFSVYNNFLSILLRCNQIQKTLLAQIGNTPQKNDHCLLLVKTRDLELLLPNKCLFRVATYNIFSLHITKFWRNGSLFCSKNLSNSLCNQIISSKRRGLIFVSVIKWDHLCSEWYGHKQTRQLYDI